MPLGLGLLQSLTYLGWLQVCNLAFTPLSTFLLKMSDDNIFSAPTKSSPRLVHPPAISASASRPIEELENEDSTVIMSDFSPSAFTENPHISTDASRDQELGHLDDVPFKLEDSVQPDPTSTDEQVYLLVHDHAATPAPIAGPSSFATPWLGTKVVASETFTPMPYKKAVGRDYSRTTIYQKTSIMHIYGEHGVLTLFGFALHMCHVLAVATKAKLLDDVAHSIRDGVINISSSLNFWIRECRLTISNPFSHILSLTPGSSTV
ncbi:hypothetical protein PM082_000313 [Marasmius tenuissimus]|nr:hypothetical protein PM082_000313 [Marasmius tenuissimus]